MIWMKPLNKQERSDYLKSIGLLLDYVTEQEDETNIILLRTKKQADIVDGLLVGVEMAVMRHYVLVWTPHSHLSDKLAMQHNLKFRHLTGERELRVPFNLCDQLLPRLGVRLKRRMSDEQRKASAERMRNIQSLAQKLR